MICRILADGKPVALWPTFVANPEFATRLFVATHARRDATDFRRDTRHAKTKHTTATRHPCRLAKVLASLRLLRTLARWFNLVTRMVRIEAKLDIVLTLPAPDTRLALMLNVLH